MVMRINQDVTPWDVFMDSRCDPSSLEIAAVTSYGIFTDISHLITLWIPFGIWPRIPLQIPVEIIPGICYGTRIPPEISQEIYKGFLCGFLQGFFWRVLRKFFQEIIKEFFKVFCTISFKMKRTVKIWNAQRSSWILKFRFDEKIYWMSRRF